MPPNHRSLGRRLLCALLLAAVCLAPRVWLWRNYAPAVYPDSDAYFNVARQIASLNFATYSGARTPGYSFLLLIAGLNPHAARWLQTVLGVATALLVYALVARRTGRLGPALAAGAICGLAPNLLFLEAALLTETLTAFLATLAVMPLLRLSRRRSLWLPWLLFGSLAALLAALTRPQYAVLALVVLLVLLWRQARARVPWRARLDPLAAYGGPWAMSLAGLFLFNYLITGSFTPSTLLGFHLMNHVGAFAEAAPDEFADVKAVYLPIRDRYVAEFGSPVGSIFVAGNELRRATGLSQGQLSERLTHMALATIVRRPDLYAQSVGQALVRAWNPRVQWIEANFTAPAAFAIAVGAWQAGQPILAAVNTLFLVAAAGWLAWRALDGRPDSFVALLISIVLAITVAQALVERGGGSRYLTPLTPLIVSAVAILLWQAGRLAAAGWRSPRRRAWFATLRLAVWKWLLGYGSRRLLAVAGLALVLLLPSLEPVARYLGLSGGLVYSAAVFSVLLAGVRYGLPWLLARWPARLTPWLAAATFLALLAALVWVYPLANPAVPGRGSDRDDALDLAAGELLQGGYPYTPRTYLGNPISPLPGAVLLAAPFVLLGGSAYQNLFWLFAFYLAAALYLRDARRALLLLWAILLLAPAVAHEFITGGDYLANSIYIWLAALLVLHSAERPRSPLRSVGAAAFLGLALASRANFWLVLPLVAAVAAGRAGWKTSLACVGVACVALLAVTLPFQLADPAAFTPARLLNRFPQYEAVLPQAGLLVPAGAALLAVALSLLPGQGSSAALLRNMAIVQGFLVVSGVVLGSVLARRIDFAGASFGLAFLFPGALAAALVALRPAASQRAPS